MKFQSVNDFATVPAERTRLCAWFIITWIKTKEAWKDRQVICNNLSTASARKNVLHKTMRNWFDVSWREEVSTRCRKVFKFNKPTLCFKHCRDYCQNQMKSLFAKRDNWGFWICLLCIPGNMNQLYAGFKI